jgi:hypothetical protein
LALGGGILAQAQQAQPTPQKPSGSKPAPAKNVKRVLGSMLETAGCTILNKGKHGQICYYDVTRLRPENPAANAAAQDVAIFISVRNHDQIMWHSGGGAQFHVVGIELKSGQNPGCPKNAFENEFKDDDNEPWHDVVSSGMPNPTAGHFGCVYKTHIKWKDGKMGDPHIIIGDDN